MNEPPLEPQTPKPSDRNALQMLEHRMNARLARLERANGRRRWISWLLLVGLAGSLALSAAIIFDPSLVAGIAGAGGEIRAQGFVLEDQEGNVRGSWYLEEDRSVRLSIHDAAGRARMNFTVREDGAPGISLADEDDRRRVVLGLLPDQTSTLVFADGNGVPRSVLGVSRQGSASLLFADQDGTSRVSLGLDANGEGRLVLPADPSLEGQESED